jgi:hypothetical protein
MIQAKKQAGLSLFWVAIFMAALSFAAMAALFAMRFERNLFAEAWSGLVRSVGVSETLKKSQHAVESSIKTESSVLRKCIVGGKVMYSNVECDVKNGNTKIVKVRDSNGFNAPKLPPPELKNEVASTMQDKMNEKAIDRSAR